MKLNIKTVLVWVLIIFIVLIAILIMFSSGQTTPSLRDRQRVRDIEYISNALETYYFDKDQYPETLEILEDINDPYIIEVPVDPSSGSEYSYIPSPIKGPYTDYRLSTPLELAEEPFTIFSGQ